MSTMECTARNAATLIAKALKPKASPARDVEFEQLLKLYVNEPEFQDLTKSIAQGFRVSIIQANEYGIVLGLIDRESPFAFKLGDLNRHFGSEDSGMIILVMIVVVIAFFPTDEALDDEEYGRGEFIRLEQLVNLLGEFLLQAKERAQTSGEESSEVDDMFAKSWQIIERLPIKKPGEQRAGKASREGLVRHVINFFEDYGFVEIHGQEVDEIRVTVKQRFRVQAAELLGNRVFAYMLSLRDKLSQKRVPDGGDIK